MAKMSLVFLVLLASPIALHAAKAESVALKDFDDMCAAGGSCSDSSTKGTALLQKRAMTERVVADSVDEQTSLTETAGSAASGCRGGRRGGSGSDHVRRRDENDNNDWNEDENEEDCNEDNNENNDENNNEENNDDENEYENNNDDNEFDFGEDEPLDIKRPKKGKELGGVKQIVKGILGKELDGVTGEVEDIAKAISKLGTSKIDIKKELKPLQDAVKDMGEIVNDAKKQRSSIIKQVGDIKDAAQDVSKAKEAIKNVASKKDLSGLSKALEENVKSAKELNKRGITAIGKVSTKNQKYARAIYNDLHDLA